MGIVYTSVLDAPREEVFDWHARPGAIHRLLPPWQPVNVVSEAASLAAGRAVLALPGGLRWTAQHQPGAYRRQAGFADALVHDGLRSLPLGLLGSWRHEHRFDVVDTGRTRITDRVDTRVPAGLLRQMFRYRHRQLAEDLAGHQWSREHGVRPATVAVTGSTGLIGTALSAFLSTGDYRVIRLVRHQPQGEGERRWDPDSPDAGLLDGVDAVVHLAGASIAGRFTAAHKEAVRNSRIEPTRRLAECAAAATEGPSTFVCASAIGMYGDDRGDVELDESASKGGGFLSDVVADWEEATMAAAAAGLRVVNVRTGIVQTPRGATLRLLRPLFAAGVGGRLGSGRQWLSWIDIDDLIDIYHRALVDPTLSGPVNAVAPHPVRNEQYTHWLARILHRPALIPVPGFGPAILLGEQGARELAMASQRVVPRRLIEDGHRFRRPTLEQCLRHQLGHLLEEDP
ncbi:TIGR01777 family oxidoreductase [Mycobacterium sp. NPDC003449]